MSARPPCDICLSLGTGTCPNNRTCVCYEGYLGVACQDPVTTKPTSISQINTGAIIAAVFGSVLFTLIVGLIIFFIWKRRVKKKSLTYLSSNSTTNTIPSSEPIVVPALYDLSLSRQDSNATSAPTMTYHLYDELP